MTETLMIRPAEEKDVRQIEEIEQECFSVPWSYKSLHQDIVENKRALYIVAEEDGQICGYAGVWKIFDEGHITNVAVTKHCRRRHLARAILTYLFEAAGKEGVKRYTLEVRAGNEPAKKLYEGLGFSEAGIRKGYYEDNGEDALIMWKE